jgi:hypothetical protein
MSLFSTLALLPVTRWHLQGSGWGAQQVCSLCQVGVRCGLPAGQVTRSCWLDHMDVGWRCFWRRGYEPPTGHRNALFATWRGDLHAARLGKRSS